MAKAELRLTPGKGLDDLTISLNDLIDQVVKSCKVSCAKSEDEEAER